MSKHLRVLVFLVVATSVPAWAQGAIPLDGDFEVNSHTTDYQRVSSVARGQDGRFVVSWQSESSPSSSLESVVARRFGADGVPLATDFQVNTTTPVVSGLGPIPSNTHSAGVADDGDFVVVWQSYSSSGTDSSSYSIQGQRYAAGGAAQGGQFQINSSTLVSQIFPSVAVEGSGEFVVIWQNFNLLDLNLKGQRFAADGGTEGAEFNVNTTTEFPEGTAVGVGAAGDFVVAWTFQYSSTDQSGRAIHARRYDADGAALGNDFQVNTYTTGDQDSPVVGVADDGSFVVVWRSAGSDGTDTDSSSIQARRYDADGAALGNDFQVNVETTGAQLNPSVASHPGGGFVAVWDGPNPEPLGGSRIVKGRVIAADGSPLGGEFPVNASTATSQDPFVAVDPDGWFVVSWTATGDLLGDEKTDIAARQFFSLLGCSPRFEDGFESGDTSAWAATVGEFAGYLDVDPSAGSVGSNGLEVTVGGTCTAAADRVIAPPPTEINGVFRGCNTLTASGVQVSGSGATFAALTSITMGQDFSVASGSPFVAALDSAFASGLAYVQDDSPNAAKSYYARFDLRLQDSDLFISGGDHVELFNGYAAAGAAEFKVILKRSMTPAENRLLLEARLDSGGTVDTSASEVTLPQGLSTLHVAWRAGAGDGLFVVSIDGAPFAGLVGLDNDQQQIDEVRWGYVGGSVSSSVGTLDLDEFSSCV